MLNDYKDVGTITVSDLCSQLHKAEVKRTVI